MYSLRGCSSNCSGARCRPPSCAGRAEGSLTGSGDVLRALGPQVSAATVAITL
jgi:hypothetical protein